MRRRATAIAAVLALAALAIVAAASAKVDRAAAPSATASADRQLVSCGKTVTMGMLAPITGPAASLGKLQTDWAKFYVAAHNGDAPYMRLLAEHGADPKMPIPWE